MLCINTFLRVDIVRLGLLDRLDIKWRVKDDFVSLTILHELAQFLY